MLKSVSGRARFVFGSAIVVALALSGMIMAAPWLAANGHPLAGALIRQMFAPLCHQIAERSFQIDGLPFAVCARCTGVYVGFALGLLLYPLFREIDSERMPRRLWIFVALAPMAIDGLGNLLGIVSSTMALRSLTGALAGAVVASFILPGLISITAPSAVSAHFQVEDDFR